MHYGVPGMKWGVRKARSVFIGRRQQQPQLKTDPSNKDRSKHWNKQQKRVGDMSTTELRRNLNRLKLENEFARQVKEATPPKSQSKAKQFILGYGKDIITSDPVKNAIKDTIKGYITGGAAGAVKGAKESAKQSAKSEAKSSAKDKIKETMANRNKNKKKKSKPDVIIVPDDEITRKGREVAIRQSEVNTVATYQSAERIGEYLEHYGVKGMRWGVRRTLRKADRLESKALGAESKAINAMKIGDAKMKKGAERYHKEMASINSAYDKKLEKRIKRVENNPKKEDKMRKLYETKEQPKLINKVNKTRKKHGDIADKIRSSATEKYWKNAGKAIEYDAALKKHLDNYMDTVPNGKQLLKDELARRKKKS